ncbi:hypothetical protein C2S51_021651 [Perilla frutescens var. frutescens]|nr:hypothetical protein C2S51_021651 [Perilla frutescens var. frutescens]
MGRVAVLSSCVVGMAGMNPTPISRWDLTPWDLQLLLLGPIQKGILLHTPQIQSLILIDRLKNSLSRALDLFPPLAGRLSTTTNHDGTEAFFVDCNNAGVEFTHAVAAAVSISDILEPKYTPEVVYSLFPLNEVLNFEGVSKPLWGVQVTELADGVFIGCAANHAVIDGTSFWHFFNSWSEISRGLDTVSKPPIFQRWFPTSLGVGNLPIHLPPLEKNLCRSSDQSPFLERVLHFSKESLAELKARANSEAGTNKITTLQALSALLWRSFIRCHCEDEEPRFVIAVGARARIPLPEGYFGNAVYVVGTATSKHEVMKEGLGYAALKINDLVAQQSREASIKFLEDWAKNPKLYRSGSYCFSVTSSPRHNVYGNDFGWGKPIAVRSGNSQKFDGKMTLYPAPEAGGIDVEVCLAPEIWEKMGDGADFLEIIN